MDAGDRSDGLSQPTSRESPCELHRPVPGGLGFPVTGRAALLLSLPANPPPRPAGLSPEWPGLASHFPKLAGSRQIYDVTVEAAQASCGSGVPFFEYKGPRGETELEPFYAEMGEEGVKAYWAKKNRLSIDGRPTGIFEEDAPA